MVLRMIPFGRPMRKYFQFDSNFISTNHGSYGTWPNQVRQAHKKLEEDLEARPDWYITYEYPRLLRQSRQLVAEFVNADENDIVLVQNATTAYNTVLRALKWEEGDYILHYDLVYGSLHNTIKYLEETTPLKSKRVDVTLPCSDDELVQKFEEAIAQVRIAGHNPRVAVFDTIVSMPGLRIPFERLVQTCREHKVLSLIDGAHGIGHIPLDLKALDPDFFLSNLHKWFFVPRGCTFMYVSKRNQHLIRTMLPTSHAFRPLDGPAQGEGPKALPPFVELFEFVGTIASQNYLTVPTAMKFRQEICGGEDAIREYCFKLAREGGRRAAEILGTEEMDCEGSCVRECAFSNVRLPIQVGDGKGQVKPEHTGAVREFFFHESTAAHNTYLQTIPYNGHFWLRFSAQVYVGIEDIEYAARAAKEVCELVRSGQALVDGYCARCVAEANSE